MRTKEGKEFPAHINANAIESLTALFIGLNIRNKVRGSGLRITGLPL